MNVASKLLSFPIIYKLSQLIFAPGAHTLLNRQLRQLITSLPTAKNLLDVGCGPSSWLWNVNRSPVGLDISYAYSKAFFKKGGHAITGSAFNLPFHNNVFDGVWCIGVLHHLQDIEAEGAILEMLRVCKPDGYIVIHDAVLPLSKVRRPVAALVRSMDRGKYMRSQAELVKLLPAHLVWKTRRFTYTLNGLEMLECATTKMSSRNE